MMLRICVSGFTCTGKTSVGKELAKDLKIMHVTKTATTSYKSLIEDMKKKRSKDKKLKLIETMDRRYAKSFDNEVVDLAKRNDSIITTWLGPWMVKDATIRVWLYASPEERARRAAKRDRVNIKTAKDYISMKDRSAINGARSLYNININDNSMHDIEINTERLSKREIISLISLLAIEKERDTKRAR